MLRAADDEQKQRLSQVIHWDYGTMWGTVRALLDLLGIEGRWAGLTYFAAVWSSATLVMPRLLGSEPATKWKPQEIAISGFHHAVYAAAVSLTYQMLKRASSLRGEAVPHAGLFADGSGRQMPLIAKAEEALRIKAG